MGGMQHSVKAASGPEASSCSTGSDVLFKGFSYLVVSQVASRAVTFFLNLVVTRMLSPEAYGLASVQFHLINTVILFLSREGFRRGCLRMAQGTGTTADKARHTLATAALCIPVGAVFTCITCWLALGWSVTSVPAGVHRTAVFIQGAAAMLELLSEPLYILAAVQLRFRLRAITDTSAIIAKSTVAVVLLQLTSLPPALALSLSQVAFAAVTIVCYALPFAQNVPEWLSGGTMSSRGSKTPASLACCDNQEIGVIAHYEFAHRSTHQGCSVGETAVAAAIGSKGALDSGANSMTSGGPARGPSDNATPPSTLRHRSKQLSQLSEEQLKLPLPRQQPLPLLHGPTLWICGSFSLQAAEKLVLAEGSKMVMAAQPPAAQGVYGLVTNLGALIVRTAFQPFEEAAFTAFSTSTDRRGDARMLAVLVRAASIVGLLAAAFGPANSWLVLRVVYSQRWSNTGAPAALAAYCPFILLLAVNGILEAFVHAVADSRQLVIANVALVTFAGSHVALSVVLVHRAGAIGLIAADCINMAARIAFSLILTRRLCTHHLPSFSLWPLLPETASVAAMAAAFCATGASAVATLGPEAAGPAPWLFHQVLKLLQTGSRSMHSLHIMRNAGFAVQASAQIGFSGCCLMTALLVIYRSERMLWSQFAAMRQK